ncbi:MAG: glycosyltransferase [Candidatus Kapaibacteriales bacterium]
MNHVLIVAYYFPPSGGPGVQRVLKYTRYLPEFGWEPIILTVENGTFPAIDESLMDQIPPKTKIFRTKIIEPYDLYRAFIGKTKNVAIDVNVIKKEGQKQSIRERIAEFIRATFFIPDARVGWLLTAKRKIIELIDEYRVDAIYSSSPPYTCSLIARYGKRKRNLPWIAGFRDPWTGFISAPKRWFIPAWIDSNLEHSVFLESDLIEVAWEGIMKDALAKYPDLPKEKFIHIPNGFDSADFPFVEYRRNKIFTLTYTGSLYGRRNPESLLLALEKLIQEGKITPNDFKLNFIGRMGSEVTAMIDSVSFRSSIEFFGYLPHHESLARLMKSDASLLIIDESKESDEIVPGKVYEYLGVGRPILAIGPTRGAVAKLLAECQAGLIAHQTQIDEISANFFNIYSSWKADQTFKPNAEVIRRYERKEHTKKLAEILTQLTKKGDS